MSVLELGAPTGKLTIETSQPAVFGALGFQRRRVVGVDVWAECPFGDKEAVARARAAADGTHLRLDAAFSEVDSYRMAGGSGLAGTRLRFVAREEDVHVTDQAICELLAGLAGRVKWSELAKLEEFDGVPAFVPLPVR
jgi:hypothetical protein